MRTSKQKASAKLQVLVDCHDYKCYKNSTIINVQKKVKGRRINLPKFTSLLMSSMSIPNNFESKPILQAQKQEMKQNEVKRTQKTDFQSIC